MTTLEAHKNLDKAYDLMNAHNTQTSRDLVLEMMEIYNKLARENLSCYRPVKNAGDASNVWIVAA
jgi:hypothetical protein